MAATRTKRTSAKRTRGQGKTRKAPPTRARRTLVASRPSLRAALTLEPHHVDVIALALIAVGIFLGGVDYLHWGGGALGSGADTALRFLFGLVGYAAPIALVVAGALLLARDWRPPTRPLRTGAVCLALALTLALAAGTLGLGPGDAAAGAFWQATAIEARGGILGEAQFYVAERLFSSAGADILAVFLAIAGVILLTGATLASVVRGARTHATSAGVALRRPPENVEEWRDQLDLLDRSEFHSGPLTVPEPGAAELIVRATHVEAPPLDGPLSGEEAGDDFAPIAAPRTARERTKPNATGLTSRPPSIDPSARTNSRHRGATARRSLTTRSSSGACRAPGFLFGPRRMRRSPTRSGRNRWRPLSSRHLGISASRRRWSVASRDPTSPDTNSGWRRASRSRVSPD